MALAAGALLGLGCGAANAVETTFVRGADLRTTILTFGADWSLDFDIGMDFMEWHALVPRAHEMGVFDRALKFMLSLRRRGISDRGARHHVPLGGRWRTGRP